MAVPHLTETPDIRRDGLIRWFGEQSQEPGLQLGLHGDDLAEHIGRHRRQPRHRSFYLPPRAVTPYVSIYLANHEAAQRVVLDIQANGGSAVAMQADISVESEVVSLFEAVDRELGCPTGLVNNSGHLERQMCLDSMDGTRLRRMFAANVIGTMLCLREAVRRMSIRSGGPGGSIVNVSSGAARYGSPGEYIDYAATKGAVETFTVGLAREVAGEGIRVNGVRPGFIYADLHAAGGEPARVDRVKTQVPMQRGGQPEEVAAAILWLLSAEASYVTGTFIDVSGGR